MEISIYDIKRIINDIFDEECRNNNLDIDRYSVTYIQYFKDIIFNKKMTLVRKVRYLALSFYSSGFNEKGTIVIFLSNKKMIRCDLLYRVLMLCYHELRHSMQKNNMVDSYDKFLYDLDNYIRSNDDYLLRHDMYSYEIGANIYGIRKTKEYLKDNYPGVYLESKEDLDRLENKYRTDYLLYDASDTFDKAVRKYRNNIKTHSYKYIENKRVSSIFNLFVNDDGSFKSLNDIINLKDIDFKIIDMVITSNTFLEELDMDSLNKEEIDYLYNSLLNANRIYNKQKEIVCESVSDLVIDKRKIVRKILLFNIYIKKLLNIRVDYLDNNKRKQVHVNDIPKYIDKVFDKKR